MLVWLINGIVERDQQIAQVLEHIHATLMLPMNHVHKSQVLRVHEKVAILHVLRISMLCAPALATPRLNVSAVAAPTATAVVTFERMTLY